MLTLQAPDEIAAALAKIIRERLELLTMAEALVQITYIQADLARFREQIKRIANSG